MPESKAFEEKYGVFQLKTHNIARGETTVGALAELMGIDIMRNKPTTRSEDDANLYIYYAPDGKKLAILDVPHLPPTSDAPKHDYLIDFALRDAKCYAVLETDMKELWIHYIKQDINDVRVFKLDYINDLTDGEKDWLSWATLYDYDMSVYQHI